MATGREKKGPLKAHLGANNAKRSCLESGEYREASYGPSRVEVYEGPLHRTTLEAVTVTVGLYHKLAKKLYHKLACMQHIHKLLYFEIQKSSKLDFMKINYI